VDKSLDNPLVTGDLRSQVMRLAWPTMFAMVLETLFSLIDAFWVGKLGADALAAVSGASFILWTIFSLAQISATGVTALVSRNIGRRDFERAKHSGVQGTILSVFLGLFFGFLGILTMGFLFDIMNLSLGVTKLAGDYLGIYLAGIFLAFVYICLESIFRASGDTRTPMIILGFGLLINAILDPILIFGYFFMPKLGVKGASYATILSYFIALSVAYFILRKRQLLPGLSSRKWITFDPRCMITIVRVGAPIAITGVSFSMVYIFLTRIISVFGTASLAALGMGHRIEGIAYLASVGFSIAAATLVGQNLGAENPKRAARAAWISTFYGSVAMGIFSLFVVFFAPQIMSLFIKDQEVILMGSQYLYIIACCEVFLAFEVILEGAFSGAGDTVPPMVVSIPITAIRIPVAYFFAIYLDLGVLAIWWVISLSTLIKGIILAFWFAHGKWQNSAQIS